MRTASVMPFADTGYKVEDCGKGNEYTDIGIVMKIYTYSEARQKLSELLTQAQNEEVLIKRRDGSLFSVKSKKEQKSPFDVTSVKSKVSAENIVDAVRDSRER